MPLESLIRLDSQFPWELEDILFKYTNKRHSCGDGADPKNVTQLRKDLEHLRRSFPKKVRYYTNRGSPRILTFKGSHM